MNSPKVLVIGLDGATFDLLTPMMGRGLLPNIQRLVERGVSGPLRSVIPPVSGPAWVSFMTGKNPGRHGVYDFHRFQAGRTGKTVFSFQDIRAKSLWEVLTEHGKTLGVINVPMTYPPYPVNGFLISGMLTPPDAGDARMHPPSLYEKLRRRFGDYIPDVWWTQYGARRKADLLRDLIECMDQKQAMTAFLMEEHPWDFLMTTITETDRLQHAFGAALFDRDGLERGREGRELSSLIDRFYRRMDEHVGRLCAMAGDDTTVMIVSDHGFGPTARFFLANRWLHRRGLLRIDWRSYYSRVWIKQAMANPAVRKAVRVLDPFGLRRRLRPRPKGGASDAMLDHRGALEESIDWANTIAYMDLDDQQGIYINLRGREPHGVVEPADYETARDRVIAELEQLVDPQTGKRVATWVRRREEVYEGECVADAPDIILRFDEFETYGVGLLDLGLFKHKIFEKPSWPLFSAHHRIDGVFVAAGPSIKEKSRVEGNLIDLFPTILYALDLPVPDDLDGKVLDTIFTDSYRAAHPVRWQETATAAQASRAPVSRSPEETAKLIESLKGLGYF